MWVRIVSPVTPRYIFFLYAAVEQANGKTQFAVATGFPNVIGVSDFITTFAIFVLPLCIINE